MVFARPCVLAATGLLASLAAARNCTTTGVHMIVTRASTELPGTGIIGAVALQVQQQIPGSDIDATIYPATLLEYVSSETQGMAALTKLITDYSTDCPDSKIVLMGYSQGAQVTADVVCGASEQNFPTTSSLSANITNKIAAIVLMGDPTHTVNATFNRGNSTKDGIFPRQNIEGCSAVQSKMVAYCNDMDTFCDSGPNNATGIGIHLQYVQTDGTDAANFVVAKVKASNSSSGSTSGAATGPSPRVTAASAAFLAAMLCLLR
ncbi:cutinase-domain-containing protein [Thozetella sp. PMI_491]|nr:cutinase-domain-containing protein [Thozetella sp. PMI_491]